MCDELKFGLEQTVERLRGNANTPYASESFTVTHKNPARLIYALYLFSMGGDILCLDAFPPASVFLPHSTVGTAKRGPVVPSLKLYCHSNITMCGNHNRDKRMLICFFWEKQCFAPLMNPCK